MKRSKIGKTRKDTRWKRREFVAAESEKREMMELSQKQGNEMRNQEI